MMNIEDKDVDSEHEPRIRAKLLSTASGAGVNAGSKVNRAFATCDPLSELVWSPKNGVGVKCANFRADDNRKPFLLWNVGLKPVVDQGNLTVSQMVLDANEIIIEKATVLKDADGLESGRELEEEADKQDAILERNVVISESREEIAAPSKKLESSVENELCRLTEKGECSLVGPELPIKNTLPIEGSCESSKICLYQEKEKGKALSNEDIYGRSSDDEDDNHESANSSNSRLSSLGKKGVKRQIFDEDMVTESKRTKMQIHRSNAKPDSSFMKWISNMTRGGLSGLNLEDSLSPLPLACSNGVLSKKYDENFMCFRPQNSNLSMGFQTVFQSLCCGETDASRKIVESIEEESREHEVDDEGSPENLRESDERSFGNSSEQTIPSIKEDDRSRDPSESKNRVIQADPLDEGAIVATKEAYPDIPLATSDVLGRSDRRVSLWISRLSTKTLRSEKGKKILVKADLDSNEESADLKSVNELCTVLPSRRFSSEAMASDFARRLDALKHITSSKKGIYLTCLYCGGCHDVRGCSSVTRSELEDLLLKSSAFDSRVEESSRFCIRCSKPDHWAVSCPAGPTSRFGARRLMLCGGEDQSLRPRDTSGVNNNAAKSEIFDAIRSLRLTRADILRWMNSNVPSSHLNGFFLRLRLGSVEAGLGESSYYVACITGDDVGGNAGCTLKKSILVDVGGILSYVACQYVSNHDFLEDEIKAWWSRTVGSGSRLPSLAELNSKFNDRQSLGL